MDFEEMLVRAKTKDLARDKRRFGTSDKTKRYEALAFPAFRGSPIRTNLFVVAWFITVFRSFRYAEARIVDHKLGRHIVL